MLTRRAAALLCQNDEGACNQDTPLLPRRRKTTPIPASTCASQKVEAKVKAEEMALPYIPLPDSLWSLRHRFPSISKTVLMQCVRCHRWVAQPVVTVPPMDASDDGERSGTEANLLSVKQRSDNLVEKSSDDENAKDEWRSPRLQMHYDKVVSFVRGTLGSRQGKGKESCPYFIPNPSTFTCQWSYCALEDTWSDLRGKWLGELYAAVDGVKGDNVGGRVQETRKRLNFQLAKELNGRRSTRLATGLNESSDMSSEGRKTRDPGTESASGGGMARHVDTLIHQDDAVLAAFCWVTCDYCGKLRRVHQPFPGGAPFVCCLALNIASCSISEVEGVNGVFGGSGKNNNISSAVAYHGTGDVALRRAVESDITSSSSATTNGRSARGSSGGSPQRSRSLESSIPLLRTLTAAIRKRSLGGFVKNILVTSDEIRSKREEVMKASLDIAGEKNHNDIVEAVKVEPIDIELVERHVKVNVATSKPVSTGCDTVEKVECSDEGDGKCHKVDETTVDVIEETGKEVSAIASRSRRLGCPPRRVALTSGDGTSDSLVTGNSTHRFVGLVRNDESCSTGTRRPRGGPMTEEDVCTNRCPELLGRVGSSEAMKSASSTDHSLPNSRSGRLSSHKLMFERTATGARGNRAPPSSLNTPVSDPNTNRRSGAAEVAAPDPYGGGSSGASCRKRDKSDNNTAVQEHDVIHWICCDLCDKWRILPQKAPENIKHWECSMRGDGTTCDDTDDEVRMNREELGRRSSGASRKRRR